MIYSTHYSMLPLRMQNLYPHVVVHAVSQSDATLFRAGGWVLLRHGD